MRRHAGQQEFHLVGQDAAPAQDHVFMKAGHVGQVIELPPQFMECAVALAAIAVATGGDAVLPGVDAPARGGHDVLPGQVIPLEAVAAIGTHLPITHEQLGVGQGGLLAPGPAGDAAMHRDDRVQFQP